MKANSSSADHEEFCRRHFDRWLTRQIDPAEILWRRGSEPPDYFLSISGNSFGVEVSRIVDGKRRTASASLCRAVCNLEEELLKKNVLRGTWDVNLEQELPEGAAMRKDFLLQIRECVERPEPERTEVVVADRLVATIARVSSTGAHLICSGIGGGGWVPEIRAEYLAILPELLARKAKALRPHRPAVLLLQDSICPISPGILRGVLTELGATKEFDAIYIIRTEEYGELVHRGSAWVVSADPDLRL